MNPTAQTTIELPLRRTLVLAEYASASAQPAFTIANLRSGQAGQRRQAAVFHQSIK